MENFIGVLQFITFGFACTPLYFVWEKFVKVHDTKSLFKRALARLPVVIPIWFLAIIFPFFGPINSTVGSLLVSFTVYIIPALAHMVTFASASAREVCSMLNQVLSLSLDKLCTIFIAILQKDTFLNLGNLTYSFLLFITECSRETTIILRRLGRIVHREHLCGGVGIDYRIWVRRMGKHAQFHTTSGYVWSLH